MFELPDKEEQLKELEHKTSQEGFWTLPQAEQTPVLRKISQLNDIIEERNSLNAMQDDLVTAYELFKESEDQELLEEIEHYCETLEKQLTHLEILNLFSGENDEGGAIMTIHPGAGGTESADWTSMLYEMYLRWGNRNNYKIDLMDLQPGDEAGIKSVTLGFSGKYAYGQLKTEIGVHRLVRISPFDANKRRHTSFASVFVYADIEENIEIEVKTDEIKVDTFRASGAGGQHVNTTDSAVRITHFPTGIVVQCQNERSQHKNRSTAMKILKARLYEHEQKALNVEKDKLNSMKQDIAWGSQIRSYVLHPYQMVKDHRTNFETGNSGAVLNGQIDDFIKEALSQKVFFKT
ncbi:MAG: peptide chain release factor 2 [SAR324 cluster bacterium]|nr:peptide chain release factor 2 [SAR324 cluster bacterium]